MNTRIIATEQFQALPSSILTYRDTQTLVEMAKGSNARTIAQAMGVTVETARTYMGRVNEKLGVNDKAAAVCRGFCLGILKPFCLVLAVSQATLGIIAEQSTRPVRTMPRVVQMVRAGRSIRDFSVIKAA